MATVHADPESQEKIDDGTAKGGWTWPWILAVVLGLVVVVLLILWACGVFSGSSELANERIVVLPRGRAWEDIPAEQRAKLDIAWEYIPQNGRYILINKDDVDKVKDWAKDAIVVAASAAVPESEGAPAQAAVAEVKLGDVTVYEPLKPLNFTVNKDGKETHADEILTYAELAAAMKQLANTVSAIAQHRARLAIKTLKLAADDGKRLDGAADSALGKMTPTEEIDEAVKIANNIKADIKSFFEDVLIPTAEKINIAQVLAPAEKAADGTVTKEAVTTANPKEMIVALLKLFVEEGGPIADKFIEMKERIVKAIVEDMSDQKTIADILSDAGKAKALVSTDKITKEEKKDDQKAFDDLMDKAFEADNAKFGELRKTHKDVETEYVREMRRQAAPPMQQQEIADIYVSCRANIIALSTQFVRPNIADVFITEAAYDAKVRDLSERSGSYVQHLIGLQAPIPAQQQPAQVPPAQEPQQHQQRHRADPPAQEPQNVRPPPATVQDDTAAPAQQPPQGQHVGEQKGHGKGNQQQKGHGKGNRRNRGAGGKESSDEEQEDKVDESK